MLINRLRNIASLLRSQGVGWLLFRVGYALRKRIGLLRLQMPLYRWADRPLETWLKPDIPSTPEAYDEWRKQHTPKFFFDPAQVERSASEVEMQAWDTQIATHEADRILNGEFKFFSHEFHRVDFPPEWQKNYFFHVTLSRRRAQAALRSEEALPRQNQIPGSQQMLPHPVPASQQEIDRHNHWTKYSDDAATDIKFIWEVNRFSFVYTLVRAYAATRDEKYAEAFWQLTESWADSNPPNTGPNWMDGQELALRLMAWTFGRYQFVNSPTSNPQRISFLTTLIASHAERIYQNRSFAIFTHSNHSITEAFGLWMTGLLFPELKNAEKYLSFGRMSLEREVNEQIFPDGTYSMYSLNYHRFVLHVYLLAIRLGKLNNLQFSNSLSSSIASSIESLSHLIDPQTGEMPVYGSNDGALVLPLNNCDFTDYRPLLQLGWYIIKGERLFDPGSWDEDVFWLCGEKFTAKKEERGKRLGELRVPGSESFPHGGVYLLRQANSKALLRCTDFRARPSHADQLHMDLWMHGHNIAIDAGTYLYSGESIWRNGLARTSVHNTVTVDGKDQMTMVSRFTWTNWSKGKVLQHSADRWQGEHDSYKPVTHKRTVMALEGDRWLVIDDLTASEPHRYALHWLLADGEYGLQKLDSGFGVWLKPSTSELADSRFNIQMGLLEGSGNFSLMRADANSTRGWRSRYYGHKEPALSLMLEARQANVTFWSFFGFENDVVEIVGNSLKINSKVISLVE